MGHWEGDTLVIETNNFNGKTRLDTNGHPHSDQLVLTEKWTRRGLGPHHLRNGTSTIPRPTPRIGRHVRQFQLNTGSDDHGILLRREQQGPVRGPHQAAEVRRQLRRVSVEWDQHPHRRLNPLTGEWVLVSPQRAGRPWQGEIEAASGCFGCPAYDPDCYLCPGNLRANGERNPAYAGTFAFDNDFPALLPDTPGSAAIADPAACWWPNPSAASAACCAFHRATT